MTIFNIKKHIPLVTVVISLLFSACGGESKRTIKEEVKGDSHQYDIVGKLIDSEVQGIEYRCGEIINFTDKNGTFLCDTLPVSFHIGAIQLGTIDKLPIDNQIFPQDIVDVNRSEVTNTHVIKIALLLQSLDSDHNASNGITIDKNISNGFKQNMILQNLSLEELKRELKEQNQTILWKDIDSVITHLSSSSGIKNDIALPTDSNYSDDNSNDTSSSTDNNHSDNNSNNASSSTDNNHSDENSNNASSSTDNNHSDENSNDTSSSTDNNHSDENSNDTSSSTDNNHSEESSNNSSSPTDDIELENNRTTSSIIGRLIDSAVQGIEYRCGETIDFTDSNGTFSCNILPVSFYIGAIQLGTVSILPTDNQIFPQDIVKVNRLDVNNKEVIKLALLLQSLDSDHNASNGIVIDKNIAKTFTKKTVVNKLSLVELKKTIKEQNSAIIFEDIKNVVNHLSFSVGIIDNNSSEENSSINTDNNTTENNTSMDTDNNNTENNVSSIDTDNNNSEENIIIDTTPPTPPIVLSVPNTTYADSISIEVKGELNSTLYINNIKTSIIGNSEKVSVILNTSGGAGIKTFTFLLKDNAGNQSKSLVIKINKLIKAPTVVVADTTPPLKPRLTTTPTITNQETLSIEVNGESGATLLVNNITKGTLSNGRLSLLLDTSGEDGVKDFNLTLKDSSNNYSEILQINIIKDTIPPAPNATLTELITDDSTPPLQGNLPSGEDDSNTTNYTIKIKLDNNHYDAINNQNGTWSIEDDVIDSLSMGYHDINITVTDEANNSSSTFIVNKIEIDNTGFLIDSAIEGIKYISGSFSGYTDKDGLFKYDKGAGVTFYIGDESTGISMGMADVKIDPYNSNRRVITLFDLAGTTDESNPKVVNMGKLLQSLDSDGDVSNGITIDDRTKESIALLNLRNHIDFNEDIEIFHNSSDIYNLMNDLAGHFGEHRGLIPTEDVKAHLVAVRDNVAITQQLSTEKVSGEKETIQVVDGVFQSIGGVVEGLEYRSGNQFGRTDANGAFKYEEGKKVKFSIYQLELGITEGKAVITPADLIPSTSFNHPKPRNIIRLLNAFDAISGDDKITIDNAVREALESYRSQIDINLPDGKADAELNIPQGEDEFGAQFEDFEMGKEILDEIDRLRG